MWFATNLGLNRYDGYRFKVFKNNKKDRSTISSDKVVGIQEDAEGYLWFQFGDSIYDVYDPHTEAFIHDCSPLLEARGLPLNPRLVVIPNRKDMYVYNFADGIYWYHHDSRKVTRFPQNGRNQGVFSKGTVIKLAISERFIWILFKDGLLERIDKKSGKLDYRNTYYQTSPFKSTIVKTILIDSDDDLWIYPSIDDKGAAYLDMKTHKWNYLDKNTSTSISRSLVRFVIQDNRGLFWIGTDHGGIHIFDKKKERSTVLLNDIYNENSISQNSTISAYCDDNGMVWIGTYKNGVCYYHPEMFKFRKPTLYYLFRQNSETFDCNSIYKDFKGNLWIGTNGAGLIRFNEKMNQTQVFRYNSSDSKSISSDIITAITGDHTSTIWIGTFLGGINAYDGNCFRHYQMDENNQNSLSSKSVYGITEDNDHNLWIGTLGGGLNRLNPERDTFTRFTTFNNKELFSDYILSIHLGPNNNVFLCTDRGLNWLTAKGKSAPVFHNEIQVSQLSGESCNNTLMDSRGWIWVATDKGITIYHPTARSYKYLTTKNGLPDEEVVSLAEDNDGCVWAGTRKGLARIYYSVSNKEESFAITTFDSKDGLPSSVCNLNAIFKDKEGYIYVGTIKGYVSFDPRKILINEVAPRPKFTELEISSHPIRPNEKYHNRIVITKTISELKELILKYNETNFSLMFSSLNYMHSEKSSYKYKLEGLDSDWNVIKKGDGIVSYSNLTPGKYDLVVYASNNDGVWSKYPLKLRIIVEPPFWATWWAYLIYLLALLGLLWQLFSFKLRKQREEFKQAQIVLDAKKMHEVDELKFKFFTNISHEFKTPITLILAPVDKLLKDEISDERKDLLNIIRRNAMTLLNMVNEILEFRKLDLNKLSLSLTRGDIVDFIRQICYSFTTLAKQRAIDFTFSSSVEKLQMDFDSEKMGRIITNLLSNAFKYTEYGEINVSLSVLENLSAETKTLLVKVSDTGIGIEEAHLPKIFDRFYRVENPNKGNFTGTGVGLHLVSEYVRLHQGEITVNSEVGKGSVFSVTIPLAGVVDYSENIFSGHTEMLDDHEQMDDSKVMKAHGQNEIELPLLLIVDDNEDFRNFIASLFAETWRLIFAQDGEEAVGIVIDQLPDIILCDVMMPRMNGYEFCRKIKNDSRTANIPVILITAKTSDENKFFGFESGADDYISKPFNIDLLVLKVSKMFERKKNLVSSQKHKIDLSPSEIVITSESEKLVKRAIAIVEENIGNPDFLVEDLCKKMAMSRVGFYKQILAITGKTPSEFIRHIRLKRAADLLEKSELYVNEIAYQVGFNDPKYFRKYFKDEFGMTPNEYKKQHAK
jgi:signal transduction histidine kinase/ligand-binding sensor domain-containing protein/AraC-like DNA-binding protein